MNYYTSNIVSCFDYYPFGMVMPGRNGGSSYRYSFNGKEKDDEVKGGGNSLNFGARIYDSRLGRFLSVDNYTKQFPHATPYSFAANSPIILIDKNGDFPWITGLVGATINVGIGFVSAKIRGEHYSGYNALKDATVGFIVGSGAALLTPMLGLSSAVTVGGKIINGAIIGMGVGVISNGLDQGIDIYAGEQEEFQMRNMLYSGLVGLITGGTTGGISAKTTKFFDKIKDKKIGELSSKELAKYGDLQTKQISKFLKMQGLKGRNLKQTLKKQVKQKLKTWENIRVSEINAIDVTVKYLTDQSIAASISLGAVKLEKEIKSNE